MPRKARSRSTTMTDALRQALAEKDVSYHELERQTGLKRQSIMKFAKGETSLRLDLADRLAEYFGLEVIKRRKR